MAPLRAPIIVSYGERAAKLPSAARRIRATARDPQNLTAHRGAPALGGAGVGHSVRLMMWKPKLVSTTPLISPGFSANAASENGLTIC